MKLHRLYFFILLAGIACSLAACGSKKTEKETESREPMIKEVTNLPDAEIKIPASIIGDELADIPVVQGTPTPAPSQLPPAGGELNDQEPDPQDGNAAGTDPDHQGASETDSGSSSQGTSDTDLSSPHGTLDDDNNITYELDGETRTRILNELAADIESSIETILADKYYYPNISDIRVNGDCTEFTIYTTTDDPNIYEAMLMLSFYTVGDRYQTYYGIPLEDVKTTVIYINETTGAELARSDSTTMQ